jgi:hypothetical protein
MSPLLTFAGRTMPHILMDGGLLKGWKSIDLQILLSASGGIHSLGFDHDGSRQPDQ